MTSRVSLAGATGVVGRAVSAVAAERDIEVMAWDPRSGERPAAGATVIAAVPEPILGELVATCVASGAHVVAACGDAATARDLSDRFDDPARAAGVSVVLTAGWDPLVADLLAARAAIDLPEPLEAHAAYATPRAGVRDRSPGERRRLSEALGRAFPVREGGEVRYEREAESRRLAWFPRPVGPRHAAGTSSATVVTLPRHLPGLRTVRGYRASSTASAELRQMVWNAARWAPVRSLVASWLTRDRARAGEPDRDLAWACVVELTDGARVSRAWAHGTDPVGLTANSLLQVASALSLTVTGFGVLAPAQVLDPGTALDDLAARSHLRWGRAASDQMGG